MMKLLQIITFSFILASSVWANQPPAGAHGFGVPCGVASPPAGSVSYMTNQSVYGYLQGFIDMTVNVPPGSCTDNVPQLDLCIYNDANNPPCDSITLYPGDSYAVSGISQNPTLTQDISVQSVIVTANIVGTSGSVLCLEMPTPYGVTPLVCKNITLPPDASPSPVAPPVGCKPASNACFGINPSQSLFNFSGSAVECVTDVMNTIFIDTTRCPTNEESYLTSLKAWGSFQAALQQSITALLILYIMMYGFNVIMHQDKFNIDSVVSHVMKFMLVTYFSIGLGPFYFDSGGNKTIHNGMIDWGLPILREATVDFAQMVFAAAGTRDLCSFDIDTYPDGEEAYALWDVIDCKIGAYLGVKSVYFIGDTTGFTEVGHPKYKGTLPLSTVIPNGDPNATPGEAAMFTLLLLLLLGGNIVLIILLISFMLVFFGVVIGFISIYIICIITLHVLVYISPIFIPLALFERTKSYFDSWLKAVIGCTLQPMVIGGFVALMMTLYDDVLFGTDPGCQFVKHQLQATFANANGAATQNYSAFEMRLPSGDVSSCTNAMGYKLLAYIEGVGQGGLNLILFIIPYASDTLNATSNALILMVFSILFYYFSQGLYEFAADIAGGVKVSDVAFKMGSVVDGAIDAIKAVANGAKGLAKAAAKDKDGDGGDKRGGGSKGGGEGDASPKGAGDAGAGAVG